MPRRADVFQLRWRRRGARARAQRGIRTVKPADETSQTPYEAIAGGFESVLTAGALNSVRGRIPSAELGKLAAALTRQPDPVLNRAARLAGDLAAVVRGNEINPADVDRRFKHPDWADNPILRRTALSYLEACQAVIDIVSYAEVDWRTRERTRLFIDNILAAAAPTNNPLLNPAAIRQAVATGGLSVVRGMRNFVSDMSTAPRIPRAADESDYTVGVDIAATPGKVVRRGRLYELIQYAPTTEVVAEVPSLFVASPVNKFYLFDLDPQSSVVAALLDRQHQPFVVSWVNPDHRHRDVGLDDYVGAIVEMLDTVAEITGSEQVHLLGPCGGGQLCFTAAGYLAAAGKSSRLATLTIGIAVLDFQRGSRMSAGLDRSAADRSISVADKHGMFDGKDIATAFAWIRPNECIWAYVVNNYLMGLKPDKFDLIYWSSDQTNLALAFGRQLLEITVANAWAEAGAVEVLGLPLDPRQITVDTYLFAASTDHISPWQSCYSTRELLGGETTFVLARGGHVAVVAKPPGAAGCTHRTSVSKSADPDEWYAESVENTGSWWEHWEQWITQRAPGTKAAPSTLGSKTYPPTTSAPGRNIRARI